MFALIKDNVVLRTGTFEQELAPELALHGGKIVEVQKLELPKDYVIDGPVEYVIEGDTVRQVAKSKYAFENYAESRKLHYPPIEDYLDGVVKNDQEQIEAYIAACKAVKARFPKN